ncbi:MAG: hypothetical protein OEY74_04505 [Gammaproteobacteria bacterium]|nr:hypothetical protein [Gammaproteobacteria bacterium]
MTGLAVLFMCTAVFSVVVLTIWCYYRILKTPAKPTVQQDDKA